ncbi:MAG: alpha/beta hydrolase [Jatrophihabitantaceae bacterium]
MTTEVRLSSQLDVGGARAVRYQTQGGAIAALQAGQPGAVPVLLVPGYTGSKEDFAPLLDPLAAAGFLVTAIDLPGQFESHGPDDPVAYTPDLLGLTVRAVAALVGDRVHLVGHSFGGLVCRAAAIAEPSAFASLVLMDSGPAALSGERSEQIELLRPALDELDLGVLHHIISGSETNAPGYVSPTAELYAFYRKRFVAGSKAMLAGMGQALLSEPDRVAELAAVDLPMLVLYGAGDDAWSPATQHDMAQRLGVEHVVIAHAIHSPAVENAGATLDALITFWRAHSAPPSGS